MDVGCIALWLMCAAIGSESTLVEVQMRHVTLHIDSAVVLEIRYLRGQMAPAHGNQPVTFDDSRSFVTQIRSAEIAIDAATLSELLNHHVFAYPGAPLKNLSIQLEQGRIREKGTLHKGVDLPFEIEGTLDVTKDGWIRLHADSVKSAHVPFKGLLHFFGADLSRLVNLKQDRGVRLEGDDILLDPKRMLPPPRISGKVTAVRLEGDKIVQTFGSGSHDDLELPYPAEAYIYHRGGSIRFGKLTMADSDLEIVNESGGAWFDFNLPEYNRQLVAGYSKNTPAQGLIVFMPDFRSLTPAR
jgi:hypothetical protein